MHYHNRRRVHESVEQELEATYWESLDQMLARMDMISVNCPHTPATFHLLSARRLALLQPHAIIVNTSRGEVVDEQALTRLLRERKIAGAGLDVFEHEPAINPKLRQLENVVLLPHMGSATIEGRIDMGEKVIINIKTFSRRPPPAGPRAAQHALNWPTSRRDADRYVVARRASGSRRRCTEQNTRILEKRWRPLGDSNPCFRRERGDNSPLCRSPTSANVLISCASSASSRSHLSGLFGNIYYR